MKQLTVGIFADSAAAEQAINRAHKEFNVENKNISYVYKNTQGEVMEVDTHDVSSDTPAEGAGKGAMIGGTLGALAGVAVVAGVIPVIGPLLAAGPLALALGFTGAAATTVASAATGAAAGGLIGALVNIGVGQEQANHYNDRVLAGDVFVSIYSDEDIESLFVNCGAIETGTYGLA